MRVPPPPRTVVPALAAVAGMVVAHAVDFLVVFPHADQRAAQLHATGHSHWPVVVGAGVAAAALAVMLAAGRGVGRALGTPTRSRLVSVPWVLGWQVTAFVVMEAGERATVGLSPSALLSSRVFWLGLLLQLPVAWLATRLLRVTEDVAFRLVSRLPRRARRPMRHLPALPQLLVRITTAIGARPRPRAPPLAPRA